MKMKTILFLITIYLFLFHKRLFHKNLSTMSSPFPSAQKDSADIRKLALGLDSSDDEGIKQAAAAYPKVARGTGRLLCTDPPSDDSVEDIELAFDANRHFVDLPDHLVSKVLEAVSPVDTNYLTLKVELDTGVPPSNLAKTLAKAKLEEIESTCSLQEMLENYYEQVVQKLPLIAARVKAVKILKRELGLLLSSLRDVGHNRMEYKTFERDVLPLITYKNLGLLNIFFDIFNKRDAHLQEDFVPVLDGIIQKNILTIFDGTLDSDFKVTRIVMPDGSVVFQVLDPENDTKKRIFEDHIFYDPEMFSKKAKRGHHHTRYDFEAEFTIAGLNSEYNASHPKAVRKRHISLKDFLKAGKDLK